jgi:hypothetical protein
LGIGRVFQKGRDAHNGRGHEAPADPHPSPYDFADYVNPRVVIVPVEVSGKAARINVTMDEALVARLASLAERSHASRSA